MRKKKKIKKMKIISTKQKNSDVYKDYTIYENVEEIEKHNIEVVNFSDAEEGDYVKTDNGYYLPVIAKRTYVVKQNNNYVRTQLQFPRAVCNFHIYKPTGHINRRAFLYISDPIKNKFVNLHDKYKLVAELMARGADVYDAYKLVYPKSSPTNTKHMVSVMLSSEKFIEYLILKADMKKLIKSLDDAGLTYEFLAEKLKERIENKNDLTTLKFAFNVVHSANTSQIDSRQSVLETQNDIERLDENLYKKLKENN